MKSFISLAFAATASAHFILDYPAARGFDEDILSTFPCGGQNTVSSNRTSWPLTGGQIGLTMGHDQANIEVLIAIGEDVGSAFNTVIVPTFLEEGLGQFCLGDVVIPESLNVTDGTKATIQVVTNGDPNGGLYNCADIVFSSTAANPSTSQCKNGTGVTTTTATVTGNPNGTSSSTTSSSSSTSSSTGAAVANIIGAGSFVLSGLAALAML